MNTTTQSNARAEIAVPPQTAPAQTWPEPFWTRKISLVLSLAFAFLLLLYAFVLIDKPDNLFADDSYFYFQVAWNFARGQGSTFNNIMPTNGYHPLWMLVCAAVYKLVPAKVPALHAIAVVIALLQASTLWTVRRLLRATAADLWPLAFALLLPFCFTSQLGTEGALSGSLLALLMLSALRLSVSPTLKIAAAFNLIAACAVLSRLDDIFIVACVWLAVLLAATPQTRRWLLALVPIFIVLWGAYLASNWFGFHTLQPISGLLKSHSLTDHALGANVPNTGRLAFVLIVLCLPLLALRKRDAFFRVVELPFALGVLCHAAYIVFVLSSETRWSWYYTSWILLASVLLARVASVLFAALPRLALPRLALPAAALALLIVAVTWFRTDYKNRFFVPDTRPSPAFQAALHANHIERIFAYDQPGKVAYYTDIQIIPLDGLMGDLKFQHDLATQGAAAVAREDRIDGFLGPGTPIHGAEDSTACRTVYLSTVHFHCEPAGPGALTLSAVDVYARFPSRLAGTLPLREDQLVWNQHLAVWKLTPADLADPSSPTAASP